MGNGYLEENNDSIGKLFVDEKINFYMFSDNYGKQNYFLVRDGTHNLMLILL